MWKAFVPIVVGVAVGLATAVVAYGLILAWTWSEIHSGRTDRPGSLEIAMSYVVLLGALAVPVGLGFLAGWVTQRAMGRGDHRGDSSGSPRATPSTTAAPSPTPRHRPAMPTPMPRLNCPDCGCSLKRPADYAATPPYEVMECPIHGPFHFGPSTALTLGRPPRI